MRRFLISVGLIWGIAVSGMAAAQERTIIGSEAPEFREAVDAWLEGRDLEALKALSALSQDGNAAAQIFLARIASRAALHQHITKDMPRKERIALMRKSGGLSGKSWLTEAQKSQPLATAFLQAGQIGKRAGAVYALLDWEEPQAAMLAAHSMLLNGEVSELVEVMEGASGQFPVEATVLASRAVSALGFESQGNGNRNVGSARSANHTFGEAMTAVEFAWVPPTLRELVEKPERRDLALRVLPNVSAWTPAREFCRKHCANTAQMCGVLAASSLVSAGPFPMRSPLEHLVSNADYWASPRIEGDLLRTFRPVRASEPWMEEIDICFVKTLRSLQ